MKENLKLMKQKKKTPKLKKPYKVKQKGLLEDLTDIQNSSWNLEENAENVSIVKTKSNSEEKENGNKPAFTNTNKSEETDDKESKHDNSANEKSSITKILSVS